MSKRFYENVSVQETPDGFAVLLDGRGLKTPGKFPLIVPREHIADLIKGEWAAQDEQIVPASMPVTRLINVALEQTPKRREALADEFCKYLSTDLLCYRANQPKELTAAQSDGWDPILLWAAQQGLSLMTTTQIRAIEQPQSTFTHARAMMDEFSDIDLTLLLHFTASLGSAILAITVLFGHIDIAKAYDLSRIDETYQAAQWGVDEAAALIAQDNKAELINLAKLLKRD